MKRCSEIIPKLEEKIFVTEKEQNTEAENQNKENRKQDEKDASGKARLFSIQLQQSYDIVPF